MGKLTLTYKYDGKTIVHELDHAGYLPDALEAFEYFLRGCGFHFSGSLDIVSDDVISTDDLEVSSVDYSEDYSVDYSEDYAGDTSSEDSSADNSGDSNEKEEQ